MVSTKLKLQWIPWLFPKRDDWKVNWILNLFPVWPSTNPVELSILYVNLYGLNGPLIVTLISPSVYLPKVTVSDNAIVPRWLELEIVENSHFGPILNLQVSLVVEFPPEHNQFSSTFHDELHPSPLTMFPSSHSRKPRLYPLPHVSSQVFIRGSNFSPLLIWAQVLQLLSFEMKVEYGQSIQLLAVAPKQFLHDLFQSWHLLSTWT